jgi:proteasome lid subunit RPN8/RPN11
LSEVRISAAAVRDVIAHARAAAPEECCGLLLGSGDEIVAARPTRNVSAQPATRFEIDPKGHIDGRRDARAQGLDVAGFYHSHPHSPAEPSAADLADAWYPDHLYLIVSLADADADVRAYRLEAGNFRRVAFVTVG